MARVVNLEALGTLFVAFIADDARAIDSDHRIADVSAARLSVEQLLVRSPAELIGAHRLAFGRAEEVFYPVDEAQVGDAARRDTVILHGLELAQDSIGDLCRSVTDEIGHPVGASAYVSDESVGKFGWHTDVWHSLIIQVQGRKVFKFRDVPDVILEPGSILMFRNGVEHRTETLKASIHISVAVRDEE